MKSINIYQIVGYIIVLFALLTSCEVENGVEGNGDVTTQRRATQKFSELDINGVLNVYYTTGESYKVEVKTDDNLHSIVQVENVGEVLRVYTRSGEDFEATQMDIYVSAPSINSIKLDGVTALYVEDPIMQNALVIDKTNTGFMRFKGSLQYLTINADGVGDIELIGKSKNVLIDNEMIGDIKAYNFIVDQMTISHGGTGTVEVNITTKIDADIHGVGNIYCKGTPTDFHRTGSGAGRLIMEQ